MQANVLLTLDLLYIFYCRLSQPYQGYYTRTVINDPSHIFSRPYLKGNVQYLL